MVCVIFLFWIQKLGLVRAGFAALVAAFISVVCLGGFAMASTHRNRTAPAVPDHGTVPVLSIYSAPCLRAPLWVRGGMEDFAVFLLPEKLTQLRHFLGIAEISNNLSLFSKLGW